MSKTDITWIVAIITVSCTGLAFAVRHVLNHFHATTVAPAISAVQGSLDKNADATVANTQALAAERDSREAAHKETRETFHAIRSGMHDLHTRVAVVENEVDGLKGKKPAPRKRGAK